MIRCLGCGASNPREARVCGWCGHSMLTPGRRGWSARFWGLVAAAIVGVLVVILAALAALSVSRSPERQAAAVTSTPAPLPPLQVALPSPIPPSGQPRAAGSASPVAVAAGTTGPSSAPAASVATPVPAVAARWARVANTGGQGANLRREPTATATVVSALAENTSVRLLGPEQRGADGRLWRQVEDQRGSQGWMPADFLVDAAAPPGG